MLRFRHQQAQASDSPILDISSLIDVCFLLLIYFLVTSTIIPREQELRLALAANSSAIPDPVVFDPLLIRVEPNGTILTGEEHALYELDSDPSMRSLPLLRTHLDLYTGAARATGAVPVIRIDADDGATQQRVIDVLDTLELVGLRNVIFSDPIFR